MWYIRVICMVGVIAAALANGGWSALDTVWAGFNTLRITAW